MIITCESCATQFQLDSARIPAEGIRVRCSICKHAFFVENHEAATGDPVDRIVGRVLADDEQGGPGVAHDLGGGGAGDRFEQSFEAARSAVDELLGFSSPAPAEPPRAGPPPAPPGEPAEVGGEALPDEIVFDVDEELAAAQAPAALPEADPFEQPPGARAPAALPEADPFAGSQAPQPPAPRAESWEPPPLHGEGAAALDDGGFDAEPDADPELDPWDTPLPDEGPAISEGDAPEPDADPWDTPLPVEDAAPPAPAAAAPAAEPAPVPLGGRWDEGWAPEPGEAQEPEPEGAVEAAADLGAAAASEEPAPGEAEAGTPSASEDDLEEALKLGWGGSTDTAGLELADAGGAAPAAGGMLAGGDAEGADWGDLALDADALGRSAGAAAGGAPAIGTRLGAPPARRVLEWLAGLGEGAGWSVVAGLAAVLLWASLAPRAATVEPAATLGIAGLQASGLAAHWVENAFAGPVLVVSGELRNPGPAARTPARLVVRLLDAAGAPLDRPPTSAGVPLDRAHLREASAADLRQAREAGAQALARARLAPGESARFEAVILSVPERASRFELASEPLEPRGPGGGGA